MLSTRINTNMKSQIHPTYQKATFSCVCGNKFDVGSTLTSYSTELCNKCHPFYTGQQKIVDTARRVEKFVKRAELKTESVVSKRDKKAADKAKKLAKQA